MAERIVREDANSKTVEEDVPSRYGGTYPRRTKYVRCCGAWLACTAFTNTCAACGTDYNTAGQRLAPREQWGEETGEHWTECL